MKSQLKILSVIMTTGMFLFAFQNCGDEVSFSTGLPGSISKADGNPVQVTELEVEDIVDETFKEIPVVDETGNVCDCETKEQKEIAVHNGDGKKGGCKNRESDKDKKSNLVEEHLKYSRMCSSAQILANKYKTDSAAIYKVRSHGLGINIFGVEGLDLLSNIRGNTLVIGTGDGARHIKEISNIRGNLVICGMSVGSLKDVRGNTVIVNGEVGTVDDKRGNLVLIRTRVQGEVTNLRGNVVQW